ncbi:uncharacterized protein VICG_00573 [Vittaforma corneae ATCC 50505]|uniref:KRR-R motif-containing protein 1 n=1 Tax=Vittaforma corneae (strain ATCC 50505) TaxID=993615 RepID=L2GPC3_VITCO|nr:uncharacterized protein VICG_00573 [Vittaforma corneae ATCC 50505]ELA42474.1 hypothetical protein VICG_00573 [Vittaforma corneae ATCC 50505]
MSKDSKSDTETKDRKFKASTFDESKVRHSFLEVSVFEVLFPKHRAQYLKGVESYAIKACEVKKVHFEVDYDKFTMRVSTTDRTRDPYIIIKAYEMIQLLGRGVTLENAVKVLEDGIASEVLQARMLCSTEKIFERRRQRLSNPKILQSIELITKTHVLISNKTVCIVGEYKGVHEAKNIIIKCFENIHPAFELKRLIIKKKLMKDNAEGDWERFLPNIKKTHSKKKKTRRETGSMPEEIHERKEDLQMQTGEYFSNPENTERLRIKEEKRKKREEIRQAKKTRFEVPNE